MSTLSSIDKLKLEYFFHMGGGYVLDFSDRSFRTFFYDNLNIDIDAEKYRKNGSSKANRLRTFWVLESNYIVGKTISLLIDYRNEKASITGELLSEKDKTLLDECFSIAESLLKDASSIEIEVFSNKTDNESWNKISQNIMESIERNDPESGLDRLHTFMVNFFRDLCQTHNIQYHKDTSLNSLAGSYVNFLRTNGFVESKMGEKILKSGVQILEDFNDIRNNKSLSHANPILNHEESVLIFKYLTSIIAYIRELEIQLSNNN